ncbi:hypothetical protein Q3G72_030518 [Acer saccharum]|nr:hypothetical protein Q3G72_030518 [Acer saccharum]
MCVCNSLSHFSIGCVQIIFGFLHFLIRNGIGHCLGEIPAIDYTDIVSRSLTPLNFSSKKQLFQCLCNPLFIDGELQLGEIIREIKNLISCLQEHFQSLGAMIQSIGAGFSEVAVLRTTHWLEMEGKIKTGMLSSNTKYGAYLVIKIRNNAYGLDSEKAELSVQVGDGQAWTETIVALGNSSKIRGCSAAAAHCTEEEQLRGSR